MSEPDTEHSRDHSARSKGETRRRLIDAAFILPAIGAVLMLIPGIWPQSTISTEGTRTSTALIYLFAIWFGMIVLAAILAKLLQNSKSDNG